MSVRSLFLDEGPGERRGVVCLDGRPERLLIERRGDLRTHQPSARVVARVRRVERALRSAFLDLGEGPDGLLAIGDHPAGAPAEGAFLEVEISAAARAAKGPLVRVVRDAEGPIRLLTSAPPLMQRLSIFAPKERIEQGPAARAAADVAQEVALQIEHPLPEGGRLFIEETQALTAIDVDLGGGAWGDGGRAAARTNRQALAWAARLLRLKGLGGVVAIDLAGKGHDGARLTALAKEVFAPDGQGVSIGPISRFGVLELALPRRTRPVSDLLLGAGGRISQEALTFSLLRKLESAAGPGLRVEAFCHPDVAGLAQTYAPELAARIGSRFAITGEARRGREEMEVVAR